MKDKPLILSLLVGLIMVLVIAGVSLLVRVNALTSSEKKMQVEKMTIAEDFEKIKQENVLLTEKNKGLAEELGKASTEAENLKTEITKLNKLKDKLEENLKEELVKQDSNVKK